MLWVQGRPTTIPDNDTDSLVLYLFLRHHAMCGTRASRWWHHRISLTPSSLFRFLCYLQYIQLQQGQANPDWGHHHCLLICNKVNADLSKYSVSMEKRREREINVCWKELRVCRSACPEDRRWFIAKISHGLNITLRDEDWTNALPKQILSTSRSSTMTKCFIQSGSLLLCSSQFPNSHHRQILPVLSTFSP